jgi:anti-sigma factor RsiW
MQEALEALHDGELKEGERRAVLAHLKECADCRLAHDRWERISRAFFRAPERPSAAETERFVRSVMAGLAESAPVSAVWGWLQAPWLIPALGAGVAALLLAVAWPEAPPPPDDLLLMGAGDRGALELVLPPDSARADAVLAGVMEGK